LKKKIYFYPTYNHEIIYTFNNYPSYYSSIYKPNLGSYLCAILINDIDIIEKNKKIKKNIILDIIKNKDLVMYTYSHGSKDVFNIFRKYVVDNITCIINEGNSTSEEIYIFNKSKQFLENIEEIFDIYNEIDKLKKEIIDIKV
jgi:hypothetical protein